MHKNLEEQGKILSSIKKLAFLIRQEGLTDEQANYLDLVEINVDSCLSLQDEILSSLVINSDNTYKTNLNKTNSPKTILLVDHDNIQLLLVQDFFIDRGHRVITASSGKEAFDKFLTHSPDIIITEGFLPGIDGFQLTKAIRKLESQESQRKTTKIIAYTSFIGAGYKENCLQAGMDLYLKRPMTRDDLIAEIENIQ
jgi:CheY-like chemotaxis protein